MKDLSVDCFHGGKMVLATCSSSVSPFLSPIRQVHPPPRWLKTGLLTTLPCPKISHTSHLHYPAPLYEGTDISTRLSANLPGGILSRGTPLSLLSAYDTSSLSFISYDTPRTTTDRLLCTCPLSLLCLRYQSVINCNYNHVPPHLLY